MSPVAIVTGAGGQDGYFLTQRLLGEGYAVHATVHRAASGDELRRLPGASGLTVREIDLCTRGLVASLIDEVRPDEIYNMAGQSSVSASFEDPSGTWRTNADAVHEMLEAVRLHSPTSRFYQSSSSEMFGSIPGKSIVHDEDSPLKPQSPYATAKVAAHLLCDFYRRTYGLRISCGILFNHESRRRPPEFLSRKVVDHVRRARDLPEAERGGAAPLAVGNLAAQRDWGFAPDYVDGIVRIARQIAIRSETRGTLPEPDEGSSYSDYVLGSGQLHAVWELIDRAFALAELPLDWDRSADDPAQWTARVRRTGALAVAVDPRLMRPTDPMAILANPARARRDLGWAPPTGIDRFLLDMLDA